jgi:hypothetical protein
VYVLLILSSLGVVFYVVMLAALYRDGRQRQLGSGTVHSVNLDTDVEVHTTGASRAATLSAGRGGSPDGVLWVPVTKHYWKPQSPTTSGKPPKRLHLAALVGGKDKLQ